MSRIAIGYREIGGVLARRQTFFLRIARGYFDRVHPGHRLWLAEPFYLEERFTGRAPTVALQAGAQPAFLGDHPDPPPGYGPRLPARFLCRAWHRHHLLIATRRAMRLQDLCAGDLAALGFESWADFAAHWDAETSLAGRGFRWRDNPEVLRIGFKLVKGKLPGDAPRPNLSGVSTPLYRRAAKLPAAAPSPPPAAAPEPTPPPPAPPPSLTTPPAPPAAVAPAPAIPKIGHVKPGPKFPVEAASARSRGDEAFLAALRRERPAGHAAAAAHTAVPVRQDTIAPPVPSTGTCPRCGTRLAYGCEHYPAHHPEASISAAVGLTKEAAE